MIERVTPLRPLSPMQYAVTMLLGLGFSHDQIAAELRIARGMVRTHMRLARAKIPGDLPREAALVAWVRGAALDVLTGQALRVEMLEQSAATRVNISPAIARVG